MKKISFLSLAIAISMIGFAQSVTPRAPLEVRTIPGIRAGANFFTFQLGNQPASNNRWAGSTRTTLHGGAFINIPVTPTGGVRFQPELQWNVLGSRLTAPGANQGFDQDMNYISMPLALQFRPGTGHFFVELVPQASYLVSARSNRAGTRDDNKEFFNSFDLQIGGGIGYLTGVGIGINARYMYGLSNLRNENSTINLGPRPEGAWRHSGLQASVFYQFGTQRRGTTTTTSSN